MLVGPAIPTLREFDPEVVISTDGYLRPEDLRRWRAATNATWALWYPDALSNLGAQDALVAPYDWLFFKDPHLVHRLTTMTSLAVHFLPEACNPKRHRPYEFSTARERAEYTCDVALFGNLYAYRVRVLEQLDRNLDLRLYGSRVRNAEPPEGTFTGRYVVGREKGLALRGARVLLNTLHYGEIESMNARLFEAAGCCAFIVTEWRPGLAKFFEDGREVISFRTVAELKSVLRDVLAWPALERERVAEAARTRAHREHTYERRLDVML
ncbi:MAG: glycosyltransferase, partial [Actinomycetota bacterium]